MKESSAQKARPDEALIQNERESEADDEREGGRTDREDERLTDETSEVIREHCGDVLESHELHARIEEVLLEERRHERADDPRVEDDGAQQHHSGQKQEREECAFAQPRAERASPGGGDARCVEVISVLLDLGTAMFTELHRWDSCSAIRVHDLRILCNSHAACA